MMKYKVNIEYLVPEFAEIELGANDAKAAEVEAISMFSLDNPEAIDVSVVKVTLTNGD